MVSLQVLFDYSNTSKACHAVGDIRDACFDVIAYRFQCFTGNIINKSLVNYKKQ